MRLHYEDENVIPDLTIELSNLIKDKLNTNNYSDIKIVCIGTDRDIADSLGPLTGKFLENYLKQYPNNFIKIFGTLDNPIHALNIEKFVMELDTSKSLVIAIDACMGDPEYRGTIQIKSGCIHPGRGAGKDLPAIGEICIKGIVASDDEFNIFSNTRLSFIYNIAEIIFEIIKNSISKELKISSKNSKSVYSLMREMIFNL